MTTTPKLTLSSSRDIPLDKLRLSQANVRQVKAGVSIEQLAEDIARRTLLQSLSVRPVLDDSGNETGLFEVPAGGRRFRALQLLVKQKRLSKTAKIPCVVRTDGIAEEDSLAENAQREALHPLDQFRAFQTLREKGLSDEDIAARFFVDAKVVRQRLKLAAASPKLLDAYAEDELSLEQLMAFCVTDDHARQESVWTKIKGSYQAEPYMIRRSLTEKAVRASDKRARYAGVEAYVAAGGVLARDLFEADGGGWLEDPALLDRLTREKLDQDAKAVRAEGWKWVEAVPEFPYGHTQGLSRVTAEVPKPSKKDEKARKALEDEFDRIEAEFAEAEEYPPEIDQRLSEIEAALDGFDERRAVYAPEDIARAGAFVSLDQAGGLRVERGYVRPEDEAAEGTAGSFASEGDDPEGRRFDDGSGAECGQAEDVAETEDDGLKPLSERLMTELTQHRTLALRDALANDPGTAYLAVLHALCLKTFYWGGFESCLEISAKSAAFAQPAAGLADMAAAQAIDQRQTAWENRLPKDAADLWEALLHLDGEDRAALLAHCAGLTVNALHEPWNRRPGAFAHADQIAQAVGLDMAAAGWKPAVETYLGRVPKARILDAVREARGEQAAQLLDHLKKADMAREAERLLDGTGWLPEPLRAPASQALEDETGGSGAPTGGDLPDFLAEAAE